MNNREEILHELQSLTATQLAHLKAQNTHPFKAPNSYFEDLKGVVQLKIDQQDASDIIAEQLDAPPEQFSVKEGAPFAVPNGYFEELSESIAFRLGDQAESNPTFLGEKVNSFRIPTAYFAHLHQEIVERVAAYQEETAPDAIKTISEENNTLGLSVPTDYFSDLHAQIMNSVSALSDGAGVSEVEEELSIPATDVFSVPDGYFAELHDSIVEQVMLAEEAPILASLKGKEVFSVPADYFESVKATDYTKATETGGLKVEHHTQDTSEKGGRVIDMTPKPNSGKSTASGLGETLRRVMSIAAVAALAYFGVQFFMAPDDGGQSLGLSSKQNCVQQAGVLDLDGADPAKIILQCLIDNYSRDQIDSIIHEEEFIVSNFDDVAVEEKLSKEVDADSLEFLIDIDASDIDELDEFDLF